jgi:hypothetical protein
VHPRIERCQETTGSHRGPAYSSSQLAAIGRITVQHSTSMSGRQGGKLKPLKVNMPSNDTDSWSL